MTKDIKELHPALLLLKKIPKGKVVSYKELARVAKTSPRAIGQILKRNQQANVYPCYKVIKSTGELGGYYGKTSGKKLQEKITKLEKDGIVIKDNKIDGRYFYIF